MKQTNRKALPVVLAGLLQLMPFLRSALPALQFAESPTGCLILRWVAGGVAYLGYHAISSASSISISPPTATIGQAYAGTLTYSGSHSGQINAMKYNGICLGSTTLAPGLTISYSSGYKANITGTPTGSATTNLTLTATVFEYGGCSGLSDTRSIGFTVQTNPIVLTAPTITVYPQSVIAQVGADALFSGGATGDPKPTYYWKQGTNYIPGATTNTLDLPAVQFTNAGVYTMYATNSQNQTPAACWLSVALTPGSNILGYHFTNYIVASNALTMNSFLTNVPSGVTTYEWNYNHTAIPGATNSTFSLTAANVVPSKSGIYSITFYSTVSSIVVVSNQEYESYWAFGFVPAVTSQPSGANVTAGTNVTFNATVTGTQPTVLWYQNGTNLIASQTLAALTNNFLVASNVSLTLSNVTTGNSGTYTVQVTNFWGSTTSSNANLTVSSGLAVSAPQGQTNYAGKSVSLSVTPSGTPPFAYQWQFGGNNLSDAGDISGSATNALTLFPAAVTNSGNYQVIVTNTSGSVTSSVAAVSIVPVPSIGLLYSGGNVTMNGSGGIAGSNYVLEMSTNLAASNWVSLQTNAVPPGGAISVTNTNTAGISSSFYRLVFP